MGVLWNELTTSSTASWHGSPSASSTGMRSCLLHIAFMIYLEQTHKRRCNIGAYLSVARTCAYACKTHDYQPGLHMPTGCWRNGPATAYPPASRPLYAMQTAATVDANHYYCLCQQLLFTKTD